MSESEATTWIGGVEHRVVPPTEKPRPQPSQTAEIEAAAERLNDRQRGNDFPHADYLPGAGEDDERPTFRNVDAAHQHREERRAEATAEREAERQREVAERDEGERREIAETTKWTGGDEHIVGAAAQRIREFNGAASTFMHMKARFDADPAMQTEENRRYLAEVAGRLKAEQDTLQHVGKVVGKAAEVKNAHARRLSLQRDIPELRDDKTRKSFVSDMAKKHKVSKEFIESVTDERLVRQEFSAWESEKSAEREKHINRAREPLFRAGPLAAGGRVDGPMTPDEAHDRLRKTGSMSDAANTLALRRERERDRNG